MAVASEVRSLTVREVVERFGVTEHTVLAWIRSGELRAINAGTARGTRPTWRILPDALDEFIAMRSSAPAPEPARATRKRRLASSGRY